MSDIKTAYWENIKEQEIYCPDIKTTITITAQTCSCCKVRSGFVGPKAYIFDSYCPHCSVKMENGYQTEILIKDNPIKTSNTLGEAMKKVRLKRGLTQKALGLQGGFPEKGADVRIAQYESNARAPRLDVMKKIETILRCRFDKVQHVEYSMEE